MDYKELTLKQLLEHEEKIIRLMTQVLLDELEAFEKRRLKELNALRQG